MVGGSRSDKRLWQEAITLRRAFDSGNAVLKTCHPYKYSYKVQLPKQPLTCIVVRIIVVADGVVIAEGLFLNL